MIWFDLDNSPHVPLFKPVFGELKKQNKEYLITARKFAQTIDLMNYWNIDFIPVGVHGGKSKVMKVMNLLNRTKQLRSVIKKQDIKLAVNHGSRTQILASKLMGIKSVWMMDYEFTDTHILNELSSYILVPKYIPESRLKASGIALKKVIRYNGFKEELYISDFKAKKDFRKRIGIPDENILVVIRPPSMTANYHNNNSERLLLEGIEYFSKKQDTTCLIVNRTKKEENFIKDNIEINGKVKFLKEAVDGLQLLHTADYAISGGGTMNRESALLGTKTFSIFTGKRPYLDEYLSQNGKLTFVEKPEDFKKIEVKRNNKREVNYKNNLSKELTDLLIELSNN